MAARAAFLDRDGTVVRDVGYARHASQLELLPGAREAMQQIRRNGWMIIIITNQSGIGRGLVTLEEYREQETRLDQLLGDDAKPNATFFCPHHPVEGLGDYKKDCNCRKPRPGMIQQAILQFNLAPLQSFAIGDNARDVAAAQAAGVKTAFRIGDPGVPDLATAARLAMQQIKN